MANYTTSSGFSDLNGSMVADGDNVTSYTSTNKGNGEVTNLGGSGLRFRVRFNGVPQPYVISGSASGNGFNGTAKNNSTTQAEEPWTATATTAAAAKQ